MRVRIRTAPRKFETVWTSMRECPLYSCFHYGLEHHTSAAGASGCSSWTGDGLVCKTNERAGCPTVEKIEGVWVKVEPHRADPSNYVMKRGAWEKV